MKKRWLETCLKIFVACALLGWFLYRSDLQLIWESISNLPIKIFFSALALNLLYIVIKSLRWRLLLPQYSLWKLMELSFIGQFYSIVSFGQFAGETAKIYILGKGNKEAGQVAMSVFIDKITGIIGLIIVAMLGLSFTPTALPARLTASFFFLAILCLTAVFLVRLPFIYQPFLTLLSNWLAKSIKLKKIIGWMISLLQAWYIYSKKTKYISFCILLSIIFQLLLTAIYMILGRGVGVQISFFDWCWVLGILSAILVMPVTIGGLGIREGSLVGLLGLFLVAAENALALSFSFFGMQLISAVIGGLIEAKRTKIFKVNTPSITENS